MDRYLHSQTPENYCQPLDHEVRWISYLLDYGHRGKFCQVLYLLPEYVEHFSFVLFINLQ